MSKGYHKTAFTLAEVLITLGVIGVVASLVLPGVVQRHKERATITQLKKTYSVLQNAYRMAQEEYGYNFVLVDTSTRAAISPKEFLEKISPYLDITVNCDETKAFCVPSRRYHYSFLEKKGTNFWGTNNAIILKDGTLIQIYSDYYAAIRIRVDVNGPKPPNHHGHDTFFFEMNMHTELNNYGKIAFQKIKPLGFDTTPAQAKKLCSFNSSEQARGCAAWILKNDNMDYLHCDLDWAVQTKCGK